MIDLKDCTGCEQDFYNDKNPYGVKKCWSRDSGTMIPRVMIHIDQRPPYRQEAQVRPSCYEMKRHIFVKPERIDAGGYLR